MSQNKIFTMAFVIASIGAGGAFADANHHDAPGKSEAMVSTEKAPNGKMGTPGHMGGGMMGGSQMGNHHEMMMSMMHMMMQMHGGMMGHSGFGGSPIQQGPFSMMGSNMIGNMDMNGDGNLTSEEAHEKLQSMHMMADKDGNGSLSLEEFEPFHAAMMRENMVDTFQMLDADGDGLVTQSEMVSPADRMGMGRGQRGK